MSLNVEPLASSLNLTLEEIKTLEEILNGSTCLIGREGFLVPLPDPLFHALLSVYQKMRKGESIMMVPSDEVVSTQVAAEALGVSRPYIVKLLENNAIPYFKVGTHRKIRIEDLNSYARARDEKRTTLLDNLFDRINSEGHYEDV